LAHKKKMGALLFTGIGRSHRGNPAASGKLEKLYGMPVPFSGTASLVLYDSEINIIDQHYKNTLCNLLKLHSGTPHSFIYFMSGSLPAKAILHQRQLSLFSMIFHLQSDPLNRRARQALTRNWKNWKLENSPENSHTWSRHIRNLAQMYDIQDPLTVIHQKPPPKEE
jgi:hypothetical protein